MRQKAQQIRRDLKIIDSINEEAAGHQLPLLFHTILLEILCKIEPPNYEKISKISNNSSAFQLRCIVSKHLHLTTHLSPRINSSEASHSFVANMVLSTEQVAQ
jgi:uncharacterized membrane protein